MPLVRGLKSAVVETLYPKVCPGCGQRGTWVCENCEPTVPLLNACTCERCGSPRQPDCETCAMLDPLIERARSAYPYMGWVAEAIRRFKYDEEFARAEDLGARLALTLQHFDRIDALVPIPLHRSRLHSRGYNQSQLLAERAATMLDIQVQPVLRRHRSTAPQVSLRGGERQLNVVDAFELDPGWAPASDRVYVLIDDVRTTGATLGACARALCGNARPTIHAATLALDVRRSELDAWIAAVRDHHVIR